MPYIEKPCSACKGSGKERVVRVAFFGLPLLRRTDMCWHCFGDGRQFVMKYHSGPDVVRWPDDDAWRLDPLTMLGVRGDDIMFADSSLLIKPQQSPHPSG